jgi:hypothetical protein
MRPSQTTSIITLYMLAAYAAGIMSMPILLYGTRSSNPHIVLYGTMGLLISAGFILLASSKLLDNMKKVKQ